MTDVTCSRCCCRRMHCARPAARECTHARQAYMGRPGHVARAIHSRLYMCVHLLCSWALACGSRGRMGMW